MAILDGAAGDSGAVLQSPSSSSSSRSTPPAATPSMLLRRRRCGRQRRALGPGAAAGAMLVVAVTAALVVGVTAAARPRQPAAAFVVVAPATVVQPRCTSSSSCSSSKPAGMFGVAPPPPPRAAAAFPLAASTALQAATATAARARWGVSGDEPSASSSDAPSRGGKRGGSGNSKPTRPPPPPVRLRPGQVVEVWQGGQVAFGNLEGRPESPSEGLGKKKGNGKGSNNSVRVRLEHGAVVTVDAGQLTGAWPVSFSSSGATAGGDGGFLAAADEHAGALCANPPCTPEGWAALRLRAGKAMRGLTPRAMEMEAFWSLATQRWKRAKLPVDSGHLAAFLFRRKEYEQALKLEVQIAQQQAQQQHQQLEGEERQGQLPVAVAAFALPPVTPAQRYAASVLLASETFRFKRCVPTLLLPPGEGEQDEEVVTIVVGAGFRPLEPSVVHSREVLSFTQAVRGAEERRKLLAAVAVGEEGEEGVGDGGGGEQQQQEQQQEQQQGRWDAAHWRMLHHLEVFAFGAGVEGLSSTSKQVLAALGEPATPQGARSVLLRAGYWSSSSTTPSSPSAAAPATSGSSDSRSADASSSFSPTPWPEATLGEAKAALERAQKRRQALGRVATPVRPGRKGPHGRHDYRASGLGAYALDPPGSEFADDALSWDSETGEVLVHIADVQPLLEGSPVLEAAAQQRGEALYLPDGPLHLLPPAALQAVSLSDRDANECVTAAFALDPSTGQVVNARLLLTLVPPITRIRYDEANDLLSSELAPPHRQQAALDLSRIREVAETRRNLTQRGFSEGRRVARVKRNSHTGELEAVAFERTAAHLMVDELLALYSEAGRRFLKSHGATLPLAPGSVSGGMDAARFGTGPLRRYTDVLAQRQICAVLRGKPPLSKAEIVRRMTRVNFQAKASRQLRAQSRTTVLLESLASFCAAQARAANAPYATVRATATGAGTEVVLSDVGVRSHVRLPGEYRKRKGGKRQRLLDLEAGRGFDVKVLKVDPRSGVVDLEFADPDRDAVFLEYDGGEEEEEGEEDGGGW